MKRRIEAYPPRRWVAAESWVKGIDPLDMERLARELSKKMGRQVLESMR